MSTSATQFAITAAGNTARRGPYVMKITIATIALSLAMAAPVIVRINDRGPFAKGRILDVSKAAARKLGFIGRGHAKVRIQRVSRNTALGVQPRWRQLAKLSRVALPTKRPATMMASPDELITAFAGS